MKKYTNYFLFLGLVIFTCAVKYVDHLQLSFMQAAAPYLFWIVPIAILIFMIVLVASTKNINNIIQMVIVAIVPSLIAYRYGFPNFLVLLTALATLAIIANNLEVIFPRKNK